MNLLNQITNVFKLINNKESYLEKPAINNNRQMMGHILTICALAFIYGLVMGSYHSILQAISAGIKLVLLFLLTLTVCFPSFFIIQKVLGSKLSLKQMTMIILNGILLSSVLAVSFIPIIVFFHFTGGNYHFLQLLHVAIFAFSSVFGLKLIISTLKYACDNMKVYPEIGNVVFKIWIVILVFVGIQLSWNLRPLLANKTEEFIIQRDYKGNFYTAVIYSIEQLFSDNNPKSDIYYNYYKDPVQDSTSNLLKDSQQ